MSPEELAGEIRNLDAEAWLCAGQSNIQKGWGEFCKTPEEKLRFEKESAMLDTIQVYFWDFNDFSFKRITKDNAGGKSALGISFAIRRAQMVKKPIVIVYVAAGGAPTEAFLSRERMCAKDEQGKCKYPHLAAIADSSTPLDKNPAFPCTWVAKEYPAAKANADEGRWWPVAEIYNYGIQPLRNVPLTGILWYQGESNATTCEIPDAPTDEDYQRETLRAVIDELRGERDILFVMFGLPVMDRPWERYRRVQQEVCKEKKAIFLDTYAAGLGESNNVHPRNKIPFAEMAVKIVEQYFKMKGES